MLKAKSIKLIIIVIVCVAMVVSGVFLTIYYINKPTKLELINDKFLFCATDSMEITHFCIEEGNGTEVALRISDAEYDVIISEMLQSGYGKWQHFEKIDKSITTIEQVKDNAEQRSLWNQRNFVPIYDIVEEYRGFKHQGGRRVYIYAYFTDSVDGYRGLYLSCNDYRKDTKPFELKENDNNN